MSFSLPGAAVGLALVAGMVMSPVRAFQAISGRLMTRSPSPPRPLGLIVMLFLFAFLFWLAVVRAAYNMELAHTCSGDSCIGYMLLALPFPFVSTLAEFLLFRARRSSSATRSRNGKTTA